MARELIVHPWIALGVSMGFNLENDKSKNDDQMSLFDFQMPKADFANSSQKSSAAQSAIDYDAFLLAHREPEQSKTSRFMTLSATLHAAIVLVVAMISVPLVEEIKTETITIEIEDVPTPRLAPRGARVPPTQGGLPVAADTPQVEKLEDAGSPSDVVIAKPKAAAKTAANKAVKTASAKAAKASAKAQAVAAKGGRSIAPKTEFKAVPMTIDDIEAPELDEGALAKHAVASNMNADFNEDFDNIDSAQGAAVENERRSMEALAAAMAAEQDESLSALEADNQAEAEKLAAMQNEMRQRNAKVISSALANERAAALAAAAAKEKAARDAAAKRAGLGGEGNGRGMGKGAGAGNSGSPGQGTALAGEPSGVRSLDQLRQMPGNPRPRYDRQERLRGDQGAVVFYAYITKEGYPQKFRMMQSTGFRNLDSKTLAALKKWRFYPGQEGWVELPFRWDLKGGAMEDGGLLRRNVGSR